MRIRAWALIREKRYSQGYLDYIHKYIVLSTHKKPINSLVSVLFGQSRDLKGLVLITLLCSYLARYAEGMPMAGVRYACTKIEDAAGIE